MSIENVGLLIEMQRNSYTLPVAYDYMCAEMENQLFYIFGIKDALEDLGETMSDEKELLRSLVFSAASVIHMNACFQQMRAEKEHQA